MNFQVRLNSLFKAEKLEQKNGIIIAMFLWCRLIKEQYYNTSYYLNGYSKIWWDTSWHINRYKQINDPLFRQRITAGSATDL